MRVGWWVHCKLLCFVYVPPTKEDKVKSLLLHCHCNGTTANPVATCSHKHLECLCCMNGADCCVSEEFFHELGLCRIVISSLIVNTSESNLRLEPLPPQPFDCYVFVSMSGNGQAQSSTINTIIDDVRWTRSLPSSRPASSSTLQTPALITRRRYLFWMLWMCWRWQREDIKPPSGRFQWSHPSSSRVLQKACQNNVPWSATTKPLTSKWYKSLLHDVEKGFVCLQRWILGDGFIFGGCIGRYKKGCSALLVPAVWDDAYLSHQVELDQAQHTGGNVSSKASTWHYQSGWIYWNLSLKEIERLSYLVSPRLNDTSITTMFFVLSSGIKLSTSSEVVDFHSYEGRLIG